MSIENTDLERRVLAHERILQTLIAHMAEAQPHFLDRLKVAFAPNAQRQEHDYTDTESYAEQFVRGIVQRSEPGSPRSFGDPSAHTAEAGAGAGSNAIAYFAVSSRAGIWTVTRNKSFYGDYSTGAAAMAAAREAIRQAHASGDTAELQAPMSADSHS